MGRTATTAAPARRGERLDGRRLAEAVADVADRRDRGTSLAPGSSALEGSRYRVDETARADEIEAAQAFD